MRKGLQVIIHGGVHKTATKSLQHLLTKNRDSLARSGIFYPDSGAPHHGSILNVRDLNARDPGWQPDRVARTLREAVDAGAQTLFLTNEIVSTLSQEQFIKLRLACGDNAVKFVFCFRHWNEYLPSRWATYSARRDSQKFEEYVALVSDPDLRHVDFYFNLVLDRAASAASAGKCEVLATSYQISHKSEDGVVGAILRASGFPGELVDELAPQTEILNKRGDWELVEAARLLNGEIAHRRGFRQNDLSRAIADYTSGQGTFDLPAKISALRPYLRDSLLETVKSYEKDRDVSAVDGTAAVHLTLRSDHGHRFVGCPEGDPFPDPSSSTLRFADVRWDEFTARHRRLVDLAVAEIEIAETEGSAVGTSR